jgi:hypothetical protein
VSEYEIRALSSETWGAFVDLCERHNGGGFGGCWCTWFHRETHSAPAPPKKPLHNAHNRRRSLRRAQRNIKQCQQVYIVGGMVVSLRC